jgi:hypothetical protein
MGQESFHSRGLRVGVSVGPIKKWVLGDEVICLIGQTNFIKIVVPLLNLPAMVGLRV